MRQLKRVLAVEDSPVKWADLQSLVEPLLPVGCELVHVGDLKAALAHIAAGGWDLLLLDVSLDVTTNGGAARGGKEFTGGLTIAGRMYYLRRSIPTIIVTGFETFITARPQTEQDVVLGLQDVDREMRRYLGDDVIGLVRYGSDNWKAELEELLRRLQA